MKKFLLLIVALTIVIFLVFCLFSCGCSNEKAEEKPEETQIVTEAEETQPRPDDWDGATQIWVANTDLSFELRVRPGYEYSLEPFGDVENQVLYENLGCVFTSPDGTEVSIHVQGLDYEKSFDSMIEFFKHSDTEKIYVGKESKTIIAVHVQNGTETLFKLGDFNCLTVIAQSEEDAEAFFGTVMIKVEGEEWSPLELVGDLKEVK